MRTSNLWDELGLPREVDPSGQSWNPTGISVFFHNLRFSDFRYWEALYWRTGYLDRGQSESGNPAFDCVGYSFVEYVRNAVGRERLDYDEAQAVALANYSDRASLWYRVARQWHMRDHMLLVFETNRARPGEEPGRGDALGLRERYHSPDPAVARKAQMELVATVAVQPDPVLKAEKILGRPYYELIDAYFGDDVAAGIEQSVAAATDDILDEAVRLMSVLHVRPYIFWCSETELMIAAARPGTHEGPWNRADVEATAPLLTSHYGRIVGGPNAGLIEWNNARRTAYEPGCDWESVEQDDVRLTEYLAHFPDLGALLTAESWSEDDRTLIHRLVRLGRFGYGLPVVRKPE